MNSLFRDLSFRIKRHSGRVCLGVFYFKEGVRR